MKKVSTFKRVTPPSYFSPDILSGISTRLREIAFSKKAVPQYVRIEKKIGRNEIVTIIVLTDGSKKTGKYKNFESDIRAGRFIVETTSI